MYEFIPLWAFSMNKSHCQQCFGGFMIKWNNSWFIYLGKAETVIITKTGQETTPGSSRRTTPSRTPSSEETGVEGIFFIPGKFFYLFLLIFYPVKYVYSFGMMFYILYFYIERENIMVFVNVSYTWALAQLKVCFWAELFLM